MFFKKNGKILSVIMGAVCIFAFCFSATATTAKLPRRATILDDGTNNKDEQKKRVTKVNLNAVTFNVNPTMSVMEIGNELRNIKKSLKGYGVRIVYFSDEAGTNETRPTKRMSDITESDNIYIKYLVGTGVDHFVYVGTKVGNSLENSGNAIKVRN